MELARKLVSTREGGGLLSTRRGTTMVAIATAVVAGLVLLVFLNRYRHNVADSGKPVSVLVAKTLIQKGTPGDVIATQDRFQVTDLRKSQVKEGAIADPAVLRTQVAAQDIYPGQQLTTSTFTHTRDQVLSRLAANQRAITVPLDSAHGMIGDVKAGDHVDVLAGFNVQPDGAGVARPVLRTLMQDVLVLRTDSSSTGGLTGGNNSNKNVVVRVSDQQAAQLAFSSDNGKVWLVLRPQNGEQIRPSLVTLNSLLFGVKAIVTRQGVR